MLLWHYRICPVGYNRPDLQRDYDRRHAAAQQAGCRVVTTDLIYKGIMTRAGGQPLQSVIWHSYNRPDLQRDYDFPTLASRRSRIAASLQQTWFTKGLWRVDERRDFVQDGDRYNRPDLQRDYDIVPRHVKLYVSPGVTTDLIYKGIMTSCSVFHIWRTCIHVTTDLIYKGIMTRT